MMTRRKRRVVRDRCGSRDVLRRPWASGSASADGLGSAYDPSKAGDQTLTMWWLGNQEIPGIEDWMKESVAALPEAHPNITVKTVLQSIDTYNTLQKTACKAGSGPDIWYNWGGTWSLELAWAGCTVRQRGCAGGRGSEAGAGDRRHPLGRQDLDLSLRAPDLPDRL